MVSGSPPGPVVGLEPPHDCGLCPRLVAFREQLRVDHPDWWNAPVPLFGDPDAWLAVIGLAPGRMGANRTGRAFTGDDAGRLLYATLLKQGLACGQFEDRADDGLRLNGVAILNAVRCVPPANRPTPREIVTCRRFFDTFVERLERVRLLVALGRIAHDAVLRQKGVRLAAHPFAHGAEHRLPDGRILLDSYHCSRLNTNTGRLTQDMFERIFVRAIEIRAFT